MLIIPVTIAIGTELLAPAQNYPRCDSRTVAERGAAVHRQRTVNQPVLAETLFVDRNSEIVAEICAGTVTDGEVGECAHWREGVADRNRPAGLREFSRAVVADVGHIRHQRSARQNVFPVRGLRVVGVATHP